jgi:hypothetical protein
MIAADIRRVVLRPADLATGATTFSAEVGVRPGEFIALHSAIATIFTDANVATRRLRLTIREQGNNANAYVAEAQKGAPAVSTVAFVWGEHLGTEGVAALGDVSYGAVPKAIFERDVVVSVQCDVGMQVGDQIRFIEVTCLVGTLEQVLMAAG